ncbi:MAG: ATP-binding cassette domain-containing protein [Mycoplasmataceae bacterium]|nr:ATP-binding cassette domain-containing protein [Mycoplasmataceae bacterium]
MSAKTLYTPNKNNAIEAQSLKIIFNEKNENRLELIDDFSYKFTKNKIYFICGDSGAGKTTLVSHFNGILKSRHGNIWIEDFLIDEKKRKIRKYKLLRKKIGMVFQFPEYQLFKSTIEKDIIFGPIALGINKKQALINAKKYINLVGLDESFLPRSPFDLSGGQKRRVAIAGILAIEPDILVLDEPTAGLDPHGEREMIDIIKQYKNTGKTVIIISHVMDHVLEIADEMIILGNKKILVAGKPYDVFTNNEILTKTTLNKPKIINTIETLVEKDKRFNKLFDIQPRTVEQLANAINSIITQKKYAK